MRRLEWGWLLALAEKQPESIIGLIRNPLFALTSRATENISGSRRRPLV